MKDILTIDTNYNGKEYKLRFEFPYSLTLEEKARYSLELNKSFLEIVTGEKIRKTSSENDVKNLLNK